MIADPKRETRANPSVNVTAAPKANAKAHPIANQVLTLAAAPIVAPKTVPSVPRTMPSPVMASKKLVSLF